MVGGKVSGRIYHLRAGLVGEAMPRKQLRRSSRGRKRKGGKLESKWWRSRAEDVSISRDWLAASWKVTLAPYKQPPYLIASQHPPIRYHKQSRI